MMSLALHLVAEVNCFASCFSLALLPTLSRHKEQRILYLIDHHPRISTHRYFDESSGSIVLP